MSSSKPKIKSADPIELAVEAADDDKIVAASKLLLNLSLANAVDMLKHGTPDVKLSLTRTFVAAIAKALGDTDEDAEKDKLRQAIEDMSAIPDD